jgi:maleylacetate reductase
MTPFTYDALPGRVVFGPGAVRRVRDEVRGLGLRRALVIGGGAAKPIADDVAEWLGDGLAGTFPEVRQHVPEDLAARAREVTVDVEADGLVTVGGGSATGLGKAIAVETGLPLLAVPTTYAGSEMTPIYGLTGEHKRTGRDLRALPRVVIYDPELTIGLPPQVTGGSGLNALAHCVEALYAPAANPVTSLVAEEGIRVLARSLPTAVAQPARPDARYDALYGAYLAGMALAVAGTALHHRLGHVLGGTFGLVHHDVNAVLLPYVAAYNAPAASDAMERVARALGGRDAPAALRGLAVEIGAATSLASIGMPADGLELAAERAVAAVGDTNPRPVDVRGLRRLLDDAYEGREPP